jgi:hypothetical protein
MKNIFSVTRCYFFLWSQKYRKSKTLQAYWKMDIYKCPKSIFENTFGNQKSLVLYILTIFILKDHILKRWYQTPA